MNKQFILKQGIEARVFQSFPQMLNKEEWYFDWYGCYVSHELMYDELCNQEIKKNSQYKLRKQNLLNILQRLERILKNKEKVPLSFVCAYENEDEDEMLRELEDFKADILNHLVDEMKDEDTWYYEIS